MNAHEAITIHSNKQHQHLVRFTELDELREQAIDEAVHQCKQNIIFNTDRINHFTMLINQHAQQGISPTRKYVTEQMIHDYVNKKKI
jgi:hypothetical protein